MTSPDVDVVDAARLAESGAALLLDVREDHEWAEGHAPHAVHLALSAFDLTAVPRDRPVLALCRVGGRSAQAAEALAASGVEVRNVTGGMLAWVEAGLPVVAPGGGPGVVR